METNPCVQRSVLNIPPWHTQSGVSSAFSTKMILLPSWIVDSSNKISTNGVFLLSGIIPPQHLSSLTISFPQDIGDSQPCDHCGVFREILLQLLKSLQKWPHIEIQCGRCLSLQKKTTHFYFLPWALHSYWDLTAQTFQQQQGHCLFSPQQFLTNSPEQVKKCILFLLLYHFSEQCSCALAQNVRGNSIFLLKDCYDKLWEAKTAEQERTSMPSYQMCFQSCTETHICIAFGEAT